MFVVLLRRTEDMPLAREVPDFTAIARASLCEALAVAPDSFRLVDSLGAAPRQAFITHLSQGSSLRSAAKSAGLNRPEAKDTLKLVADSAVRYHVSAFGRVRAGHSNHRSAWAFSEKERTPRPSPRDKSDERAAWTHVWVDEATGLLEYWLTGPEARHLASERSGAETVRALTERWRAARSDGFMKRVELHAQALAFFALHYNFCRVRSRGETPAMKCGVADRAWGAADVDAIISVAETRGAA